MLFLINQWTKTSAYRQKLDFLAKKPKAKAILACLKIDLKRDQCDQIRQKIATLACEVICKSPTQHTSIRWLYDLDYLDLDGFKT